MKRKSFKLGILFLLALAPVQAEEVILKLSDSSAKQIKKISALEVKFSIKPENSFMLKEKLEILVNNQNLDKEILYKVVDQENHSIRVFFDDDKDSPINFAKELIIKGELERSNFSGSPDITIAKTNYVSRFAQNLDESKIKLNLAIDGAGDVLPFWGISKAEILGPLKRTFSEQVYITIGNIETYGFSLDKNIAKARINGVNAKLINNEIIMAKLAIDKELNKESLDISLELDVDNQIVSKKIGTIEFYESIW